MWRVLKHKASLRKKAVLIALAGGWPRYEVRVEAGNGGFALLSCSRRSGPGAAVERLLSGWAFPAEALGALAWLVLRHRVGGVLKVPVVGLRGAFSRERSVEWVRPDTLEWERQQAINEGRRLELEDIERGTLLTVSRTVVDDGDGYEMGPDPDDEQER